MTTGRPAKYIADGSDVWTVDEDGRKVKWFGRVDDAPLVAKLLNEDLLRRLAGPIDPTRIPQ